MMPGLHQRGELSQLKERWETVPKNWELADELHYYKNRLFIPSNKELVRRLQKDVATQGSLDTSDRQKRSKKTRETSTGINSGNGSTTVSGLATNVNITNLHHTRSMDYSTQ